MQVDKKHLIKALNASARDLQQDITMHYGLMASILEGEVDEKHLQHFLNVCPRCTREKHLEAAIREAIEILEESRKSFKSKQLEQLRIRLSRVLTERRL
ncbi:hypothetical protein LZ24_00350 [Desulfobotulus alkaliphilus]|uniref:Uncharacterized protein n=1 Tax=Desulfobotulus alkaliphilus TaxID=622671 RepID=A0A562S5V9_9BACT|nr:hypothetical protein [Desulfobotulus alkaliphilus]TWI76729.1 hypothetical protein LZ24_00350 [Desulfobotulus alkaliphilus]